jgi:hypothetical protein
MLHTCSIIDWDGLFSAYDNTMVKTKRQKDKHWFTKHYTENQTLSNPICHADKNWW